VKSGCFVTAGAALSHIDLALWVVRGVSPRLASLTAKYLIVDSRPSQSVYALTDHLVHSDPVVQRFEGWARARLTDGFSLDDAARAVGSSKRTLARRMQSVLGKSPLSYFQSLRVERAVHLLQTGSASVEEVAECVGYTDGATLRTLLRRRLNLGVREIRRTQWQWLWDEHQRLLVLKISVIEAGERNPHTLAALRDGRIKASADTIAKSTVVS